MTIGGFLSGVGQGVYGAAKGTWEGARALAKGGYTLATDSQTREQVWQQTKEVIAGVQAYGEKAADDPSTVWRDGKQLAGEAWTAADKFRETASPEDWGKLAGGGAFEVVTALVPIGAATKLTKVGRVGKVMDKATDATRSAGKLLDAPIPGPVTKCPIKKIAQDNALRKDLRVKAKAKGEFDWPEKDGFAAVPKVRPLEKGELIDRYSVFSGMADDGRFFGKVGDSFDKRSLPYDPARVKYTRYEVLKPFEVKEGPIAPAFGHDGGGTQYHSPVPVSQLIKQGYIKEVK